jgi:CheY-like chemotaxis protein
MNYRDRKEVISNLTRASVVSAFAGLWLLVIADVAWGRGAPTSPPSRSPAQVGVIPGQESADLLKAEIEHLQRSVQATTNAFQAYTTLLEDEANTSRDLTEKDLNAVDRALYALYWTILGIGALVSFAGTVLVILGIRRLSDVKKMVQKRARKVQSEMEEQIRGDLATIRETARVQFEEMMKTEFAGFETDLSDTRDQLGKLVAELVDRTRKVISVPGKSVVWVDDQPKSIAAPLDELKKRGVKVDVVASTEQLEQKLKEKHNVGEKYDLIISDIGRPGNDRAGLDYLKEIRDRPDLPKRLVFSFPRLMNKYAVELKRLEDNPLFLGAFSEYEPFYAALFKALGAI